MDDVAIAGAGPAGALAAIILARAGLRVRLFDRARFPRHKLCGDTLNPGALAVLRRHVDVVVAASRRAIRSTACCSPARAACACAAKYGRGLAGRVDHARGARSVAGRRAPSRPVRRSKRASLVNDAAIADGRVAGVRLGRADGRGHASGADGDRRRRPPLDAGDRARPVAPAAAAAAMGRSASTSRDVDRSDHARRDARAPRTLHRRGAGAGRPDQCLPRGAARRRRRISRSPQPRAQCSTAIFDDDPELSPRFARARAVAPPSVLGPMAVDAQAAGSPACCWPAMRPGSSIR